MTTERDAPAADDALTSLTTRLSELEREVKWASDVLDGWGAPKTVRNPYDHENQELNLAGRISYLVDPKNEGWRESQLARLSRLEEALELWREAYRPYREDMVRHALELTDAALDSETKER